MGGDLRDGRRRLIAAAPHLVTAQNASSVLITQPKIERLEVTFSPVQSGSGTPSPSNVRAISGWTNIGVHIGSKNLYDVSAYPLTSGWLNSTTGKVGTNTSYLHTEDFIPIAPYRGATLTLNKRPGGNSPGFAFYTSAYVSSYISGVPNDNVTAGTPMTFTVPGNANYMRFCVPDGTNDVQIEVGSSATTYEPYRGITATADLGGTYYGGTVDLVSGTMTVTHALAKVSDYDWSYQSSNTRFTAQVNGLKLSSAARTTPFVASCFESIDDGRAVGSVPNNGIYAGVGTTWVYIKCTDYNTKSAFVNAYGGQSFVYQLETPQTVTLTPQTIAALRGQQSVSSPAGSVDITYWTN